MNRIRIFGLAPLALALTVLCRPAVADAVADFYKDRQMTIVCGYSAGGTYDRTARLLAKHLGKHLPGNPSLIVKNMPGTGSIKAILHLYNVAPKDGSTLGVVARSYPIEPAFEPEKAKYDPSRFIPLGSTSTEVSVAVTWHESPVKSFKDLMARETTFGATGFRDDTGRFPLLARNLTGAKIKVVTGYPGGNEVTMAMERGEVEGRFAWSWGSVKSRSRPWLDGRKINIIAQMGLAKARDLPNVPLLLDYATTPQDRAALELLFAPQAVAWPLIAPPDVPADRVAALRKAFDATMTDAEFVAEATKQRIDVDPVSGAEMEAIVKRIVTFDKSVIDRAKALTTAN